MICCAISAPAPPVLCATWVITARPVFRTDSTIVSMSSGASVRGSMISTLMPSAASASAASTARGTIDASATTVTSLPVRTTCASPNGIRYSSSGTSTRLG